MFTPLATTSLSQILAGSNIVARYAESQWNFGDQMIHIGSRSASDVNNSKNGGLSILSTRSAIVKQDHKITGYANKIIINHEKKRALDAQKRAEEATKASKAVGKWSISAVKQLTSSWNEQELQDTVTMIGMANAANLGAKEAKEMAKNAYTQAEKNIETLKWLNKNKLSGVPTPSHNIRKPKPKGSGGRNRVRKDSSGGQAGTRGGKAPRSQAKTGGSGGKQHNKQTSKQSGSRGG